MIRLKKSAKPKILAENADKWTKLYCDCIAQGCKPDKTLATKYNHPTIKKALEHETNEKCAYCESKITHVYHGDIEHILPKNKNARPDLCFEWDNLTLACAKCNQSGKGDYYNVALPLINPYTDYPEKHFQALGAFIFNTVGDERAIITEKTLGLNRTPLVERRKKRIDDIEPLLEIWYNTDSRSPRKVILEDQLHIEYGKDKEFSFTIKQHLSYRGFPVKDNI